MSTGKIASPNVTGAGRLRPPCGGSEPLKLRSCTSGGGLRVDDCVAGACISACGCPYPFHQRRTDLSTESASDCGVIKIGHCCVRWKIVGQISPFAAVFYQIQHRIYQFLLFPFAPVSCSGKQRLQHRPLTVAQIARISASLIFLYHASRIASFYLLVQLLSVQGAHAVVASS